MRFAVVYRAVCTALTVVSLSSCGGGLNCPIDPPSCCYDQLFGCGTFDLPFGCTCESYGINSAARASRALQTPMNDSINGAWRGVFVREQSSCAGLPETLRGGIGVSGSRRSVRVAVPGYGVLRGTRYSTGFKASGFFAPFSPLCRGKVQVTFDRNDTTSASVRAAMSYSCGRRSICSARYAGQLVLERGF